MPDYKVSQNDYRAWNRSPYNIFLRVFFFNFQESELSFTKFS